MTVDRPSDRSLGSYGKSDLWHSYRSAKVRIMQSRLQGIPSHLVAFMMRHPVGIVLAAVLGVVFALLYTATHLAFDSNRLDLVSAGEHY